MEDTYWQSRTALLLNEDHLKKLRNSHVLQVGLGGVGGICAEMLVRAGIGKITVVDGDVVEASNRNRQIVALMSTNGRAKTEAMAERLLDINPALKIKLITTHLEKEEMNLLPGAGTDLVMDCIDTLGPKVSLLCASLNAGIPVVSSMGAGGMTDPSQIKTGDISESRNCQLAYYVRKRLHREGIRTGIRAVWSEELADYSKIIPAPEGSPKKSIIGTVPWMPNLFGITAAAEGVRILLGGKFQ